MIAHLNPATRALLNAAPAARAAWIQEDHWVNTQVGDIAFQWMDYMLVSQRRLRPICLLLTAKAGVGKSALLAHFAMRHPARPTADDPLRHFRPVLLADALGCGASVEGLRAAIMRGAWPGAIEYKKYANQDCVDATLRQQCVRLLLLDEAGELLRCGPAATKRLTGELRRITHHHRINIAAASVASLKHVFKLDEQMDTRYKKELDLAPWAETQALRNFLCSFECFLPFPQRSHLDDKKIVKLLLKQSSGVTEDIVLLIQFAALRALELGKTRVELKDFDWVIESPVPPKFEVEEAVA